MKTLITIFALLFLNTIYVSADCKKAEQFYLDNEFKKSLKELETSDCDKDFTNKLKGANYFKLFKTDSVLYYLKPYFSKKDLNDTLTIMLSESMLWIKEYKSSKMVLETVKDKTFPFYRKVKIEQLQIEGDHKKLIKYYDEGIKNGEYVLEYTLYKGIAYKWLKKYSKAIKYFDEVLKNQYSTKPLKVEALVEKATIYSWQKKLGKALETIDEATSMDKNNYKALMLKAQIYEWMGEYKKAKKTYIKLFKLYPEEKDIKVKLDELMWVEL